MTDTTREALKVLIHIIEDAGLLNLSNGVLLGPTVWYVKASDAVKFAKEALAAANARPDFSKFATLEDYQAALAAKSAQIEAWMVPTLISFNGVRTSCPEEHQEGIEGTVAWRPEVYFDDDYPVIDKFGVAHRPYALSRHIAALPAQVDAQIDRDALIEIRAMKGAANAEAQTATFIDEGSRQAVTLDKVEMVAELVVGREYWLRDKKNGNWHVSECREDGAWRYFENRIWAQPDNNQAMQRWDIFGPTPVPQAVSPINDGDMRQGRYDTTASPAFDRLLASGEEGMDVTQTAQPISEQSARFAIDGAITFGKMNTNRPPTDDHWLMPYWEIGRQIRECHGCLCNTAKGLPQPVSGAVDEREAMKLVRDTLQYYADGDHIQHDKMGIATQPYVEPGHRAKDALAALTPLSAVNQVNAAQPAEVKAWMLEFDEERIVTTDPHEAEAWRTQHDNAYDVVPLGVIHAVQPEKDAERIADVILHLMGGGHIDWENPGQSYEGEDDGGFNSRAQERDYLRGLIVKAESAIAAQPASNPTDKDA